MGSLKCKKPKLCEPKPEPKQTPCPHKLNLCVGDRTLTWDGVCLTVERTRNTPDGTYTSITVVDGCVVGFGYADEATYTPPFCNPNPVSCKNTGANNTTAITLSSKADNLLTKAPDGLYSHTHIQGGKGIAISGVGTLAQPYVISSTQSNTGASAIVGRDGLTAETSTNGVTYISLEKTGVKQGVYDVTDRFTVDGFGRITSVEPRTEPIVAAGTGLQATSEGDSVTIAHPTVDIDETMVLGAYTVKLNNSGHITETKQAIAITEGVYNIGAYNIGVNEFGSITSIAQRSDVMPSDGTFTTVDGKKLSYDVTGRLVAVEPIGDTASTPALLPLRDMYKFNFATTGNTGAGYTIDTYGTPISPNISGKRTMTIPLPAYISEQTQVQVNGASSWRIIPSDHLLEVKWAESTNNFTVAFRG